MNPPIEASDPQMRFTVRIEGWTRNPGKVQRTVSAIVLEMVEFGEDVTHQSVQIEVPGEIRIVNA